MQLCQQKQCLLLVGAVNEDGIGLALMGDVHGELAYEANSKERLK